MRKMEREAVSRRDRDRQIYGVRERMRIRERQKKEKVERDRRKQIYRTWMCVSTLSISKKLICVLTCIVVSRVRTFLFSLLFVDQAWGKDIETVRDAERDRESENKKDRK